MFVEICLPIHSYQLFTYKAPNTISNKLVLGDCVFVRFGNKSLQGHIVQIIDKPQFEGDILEIDSIAPSTYRIPSDLWKTILFTSKYYLSPIGKTARAAVPINMFKNYKNKQSTFVKITKLGNQSVNKLSSKAYKQKEVLLYYKKATNKENINLIFDKLDIKKNVIDALQKKGYLHIIKKDDKLITKNNTDSITLSAEQQNVYDNISGASKKSAHLIHGVPGSGKTEIYIKLIGQVVKQGEGAIVLVPEISLTPQIVDRFIDMFGESVGLWHSRLTENERGVLWHQIQSGTKKIVIGPRSAVFAPIQKLGIIVIDEEQESSYKQEETEPRYHARDIALVRSRAAKCRAVLLSATPSVESMFNSKSEKLTKHILDKKYIESEFPYTELIDIAGKNNNQILSPKLINAMNRALQNNEQVIILQNRRGYSIIEKCRKCNNISECPNCSVTLTHHKSGNALLCHYCDYKSDVRFKCELCGGELDYLGHGTENIESIIKRLFPKNKVLRMDTDSTKGKNTHRKIINNFSKGDADILLGTQMVAKGLDFSNVTVVGVVNADHGLHVPDFRSSEKIFQLIYQVIGRAGRRKKKGTAIIQTYNSNDKVLTAAAQMKDAFFYDNVLKERKQYLYPPYSKIARVLVLGSNNDTVQKHSKKIKSLIARNNNLIVIGPSPAPISRIRKMYRYHILVKTKLKKAFTIQTLLYKTLSEAYLNQRRTKFIKVQIDIDPITML